MTQEIVVYRNPLEKLMWDFWLGPQGSAIIVWLSAIALVVILGYIVWAVAVAPIVTAWQRRSRR